MKLKDIAPLDGWDRGSPAGFDSVSTIVQAILRIAPVSEWHYAGYSSSTGITVGLKSFGAVAEAAAIERQFFLQSEQFTGRSMVPARIPIGPFERSLNLLFADERSRFGMLTLLRTADLGDFSRSEIHALTFALHAASDRLSELRLMESDAGAWPATKAAEDVEAAPGALAADMSSLYLLNERFEIVLTWTSHGERRAALRGVEPVVPDRLPAVLEGAVRRLTAAWTDVERLPGRARPLPFLELRTRSMSGALGDFIGVSIERAKPRRSLTAAAARFKISPREAQVLALLLDGLSLNETAKRLHITSSTVQDHVQHLLRKTGTRSRLEMTAKILGWD